MKTHLVAVLLFMAMSVSGIEPALATGSPSISLTSSCDFIEYVHGRISCGPAIITVSSVNGFSGTVILSAQVTYYCTNCSLTATMSPNSVSVSSGGNASSTLRLIPSCQSQNYCVWDVTIKGTSGNISNSTDVVVCWANLVCPH